MNRQKYLALIGCLCCLTFGFSGCSKGILTPPPTRVVLEIESSATINPDIQKIPSPVVVRFYQLKSPSKFNEADFISLYENDEQVLGDDLVHSQEILLSPKDKKNIAFEAEDNVRCISCLATFRQQNKGHWRASTMVEPHKTTTINVSVSGTTIKMTPKP